MNPYSLIVDAALTLAGSLPSSTLDGFADAVLTSAQSNVRAEVVRRIPHHHHRDLALGFLDRWQRDAPTLDASVVGIALKTAALAETRHRDSQSVELAWTGPDTGDSPMRRTEQAILQVLDSAQERITLVSFAIYRIPNIARSLVRAVERGVKLKVIVETPDRLGGENEYSTLRALGREIAACSSLYFWPKENRPVGDHGKSGILHVKCAVADGEWLFLSSANLTSQAFTINMELGVLLRKGTMPRRVEQCFDSLIDRGVLVRV